MAYNINKLQKMNTFINVDLILKRIYIKFNNKNIGWIDFKEIENSNNDLYLLHNFYVIPEKRNLGFGKQLFKYSIDYFSQKKAKKIFLIPEPYEIEIINNKTEEKKLSIEEKDLNLEKLINFYSNFGFDFLNDLEKSEKLLEAFNFSGKAYRLMFLEF